MTDRLQAKIAIVAGSGRGIGAAIAELASDEARFINAADILIDGGRSPLYHE